MAGEKEIRIESTDVRLAVRTRSLIAAGSIVVALQLPEIAVVAAMIERTDINCIDIGIAFELCDSTYARRGTEGVRLFPHPFWWVAELLPSPFLQFLCCAILLRRIHDFWSC